MSNEYVDISEFGFQMNLDLNEYIDNAIMKKNFEPVTAKWIVRAGLKAFGCFNSVGKFHRLSAVISASQ